MIAIKPVEVVLPIYRDDPVAKAKELLKTVRRKSKKKQLPKKGKTK